MKITFTQPTALQDGRQFDTGDTADLPEAVAAFSLAAGHATTEDKPRRGKSADVETATL